MFTDKYLVNQASGLRNTAELITLLALYKKYLGTYKDALINRMNTMSTLTYEDRVIDLLYFQTSGYDPMAIEVLKAYVNNVWKSDCSLPDVASINTVVFMALYNFSDVKLNQSREWLQRGDQYKPHLAKLMMELLNVYDAFYIKEVNMQNALQSITDMQQFFGFIKQNTNEVIKQMQETQLTDEKKRAVQTAVLRLRDIYFHPVPSLVDFLTRYKKMVMEENTRTTIQSDYPMYKNYLSEDLYDYAVMTLATFAKYAETDPHRFTIGLSEIVTEISSEVTNMKDNYKVYQILFKQVLNRINVLGDITPSQYVCALGVVESLPYQAMIDFGINDGTEYDPEDDEEDSDSTVDTPVILNAAPGMEAASKSSTVIQQSSQKIYNGYKKYKKNADIVESQLNKMLNAAKRAFVGDVKKEVIAGKEFTPVDILKKALHTVALFSIAGPIKGIILLVVRTTMRKNSTRAERKRVVIELQREIEILEEKIQDARGDGNRKAKYAMMRTKGELQAALERVQYGLEADQNARASANKAINKVRGL